MKIKRREEIRSKGTGRRSRRVPWSKAPGDLHCLEYWSYKIFSNLAQTPIKLCLLWISLLHSNPILGQLVEKQNKYLALLVIRFQSSCLLSFQECEIDASSSMWVYVFLGNLLRGIGETPIQPLGIAYLDDFASEDNAAFYIGNAHLAHLLRKQGTWFSQCHSKLNRVWEVLYFTSNTVIQFTHIWSPHWGFW